MRIDLTVAGPAGEHDVAVELPGPTPLSAVASSLAAVAGAARDELPTIAGRTAAADTPLGSAGLRSGAVLRFGAVSPPATVLDGVEVTGGPSGGRGAGWRAGRVVVGRGDDCDLTVDDDRASRRHAALTIGPDGVHVTDLGSTNGTTVDGAAVGPGGAAVGADQLVRVGDSLIGRIRVPAAAVNAAATDESWARVVVNRPPRPAPLPDPPAVPHPSLAAEARPGRVQWAAALVPAVAVAGGCLALAMHSPQFLLFALLSPLLLLSTALGDRIHRRRSRRRSAAAFRRDLARATDRVAAGLAAETVRRREEFPGPPTVLRTATLPGVRLWERRRADPDHLLVRLGTADLPSRLRREADGATNRAGTVPSVPVTVSLRSGALGLAGPAPVLAGMLRWIVGQLAVAHAPDELDVVLVLGPARLDAWRWCRWLPSLTGPPASVEAAVATITTTIDRRRQLPDTGRDGWPGRWTLVVVDGVAATDLPAVDAALVAGAPLGVVAVCAAGDPRALPSACRSVAVVGEDGRLELRTDGAAPVRGVVADRVSPGWADALARGLAPLQGASGAAALPDRVRLADLVPTAAAHRDPAEVRRVWREADGGARAVVGRGPDGPVAVDLVADGPHALVAGTTGSGKSELLRTLVVGLAAGHPPDAMTFLLIDYKGGAAFAGCARLPHTAGVVTDLDAAATTRALRSLHAELRRREQVLAAAGAASLAELRVRGGPVPARLVIVVDEFAELAAELPDFVTGLVGVARRGRSLGVHLVLATQRPGSSVSPEIRANTSLRIALRVTDTAESADVIDVPDAAGLDPARPGRGYLRAGGALVPLQAAVVAAPLAAAGPVVRRLDGWRQPMASAAGPACELDAPVGLLARSAEQAGVRRARSPWLPPLPTRIPLDDVLGDGPEPGIGRVDAPDEPAQPALTLGRTPSLLVVGANGSGRTGALTTVALAAATRHRPGELHLHVIDGGGALATTLASLPHLGTVAGPGALGLVPVLLERLCGRPDASGPGASGLDASGLDASGPDVLLLVDDWDRVLAERDDLGAAHCADLLVRLVRSGPSVGVGVAVAGGRSLLQPRLAAGFELRLLLRLADGADAGLAGVAIRDVPAGLTPGRGLRAGDGLLVQLAHAGDDPAPDAARRAVAALARRRPRQHGDPPPLMLRGLPDRISLDELPGPAGPALRLGLAGDAASPCAVDLVGHRARLLVAGPPRSGRTAALHTVLAEARRHGLDVAVLAPVRSPLTAAARAHGARLLDATAEPGPPPDRPTVLLVDDDDAFVDAPATPGLLDWVRGDAGAAPAPLAVVVAARTDDLLTGHRGLGAEVRRRRCGILLRPGPVDGEILGVRAAPGRWSAGPGTGAPGPPGRGIVVGDPRWGPLFGTGAALAVQLAEPPRTTGESG